jgi:hypothetical protein
VFSGLASHAGLSPNTVSANLKELSGKVRDWIGNQTLRAPLRFNAKLLHAVSKS